MAPQLQQTTEIARGIEKAIAKNILPLSETMQQFSQVAALNLEKVLEPLQQVYKSKKRRDRLFKMGWVYSPYLRGTSIAKALLEESFHSLPQEGVDALFIDFFTQDGCCELQGMVSSWEDSYYLKGRLGIIKDCLAVVRHFYDSKVNAANVVIPTLIAQIDGTIHDIVTDLGLERQGTRYVRKVDNGELINVNRYKEFKRTVGLFDMYGIEYLHLVLFAKDGMTEDERENNAVLKIKPLATLNRHSALHGEDTEYGTIDNLVKMMLLLDFLSEFPAFDKELDAA